MKNDLAELFKKLCTDLEYIVHPCKVTKNSSTAYEVWATAGITSSFFCSLHLSDSLLSLKISPHVPNKELSCIKDFQVNHSEFIFTPDDITEDLEAQIVSAFEILYKYYLKQYLI